MPDKYTASVKVMRSYDYCHFEVNLGTTEPISLDDVDEMRKRAARLADKAVKQYRIAKDVAEEARAAAGRTGANGWMQPQYESALATPEADRSQNEKATIKEYQDALHASSRRYNYEDDFEQEDFD